MGKAVADSDQIGLLLGQTVTGSGQVSLLCFQRISRPHHAREFTAQIFVERRQARSLGRELFNARESISRQTLLAVQLGAQCQLLRLQTLIQCLRRERPLLLFTTFGHPLRLLQEQALPSGKQGLPLSFARGCLESGRLKLMPQFLQIGLDAPLLHLDVISPQQPCVVREDRLGVFGFELKSHRTKKLQRVGYGLVTLIELFNGATHDHSCK